MSTLIGTTEVPTKVIDQHYNMLRYAIEEGINDISNLHSEVFNSGYFIRGHARAEEWLFDIFGSVFDAINFVTEYNRSSCNGYITPMSAICISDMCSYIVGERIILDIQSKIDKEINDITIEDYKLVLDMD